MNDDRISALLTRYHSGTTTDEELLILENLIEKGLVDLTDLKDVRELQMQMDKLETPAPSLQLDDRFYEILANEKQSQRRFNFVSWFSANTAFTQLGYATLIFAAGLGIGYFILAGTPAAKTEMTALSDEVRSLKEMMMLSLLEKESATERLKAVSLSHEFDQSSTAVTAALIKTLNNDENVNVRLAALEALKPYGRRSEIRQELISSISRQDSPLVQIALAELMADLQERSSVKEFDKFLKDEKTPGEIKKRIRKSLEVLI